MQTQLQEMIESAKIAAKAVEAMDRNSFQAAIGWENAWPDNFFMHHVQAFVDASKLPKSGFSPQFESFMHHRLGFVFEKGEWKIFRTIEMPAN